MSAMIRQLEIYRNIYPNARHLDASIPTCGRDFDSDSLMQANFNAAATHIPIPILSRNL